MDATVGTQDGSRWLALIALGLGMSMTAMNASTVHVALASITSEMPFAPGAAVWVINVYLVTYGCCLLLAGRLGDLFGYRPVFLIAVLCFTVASLGCGLAESPAMLIAARAAQGVSGAMISTLALTQATYLFPDARGRARALAVYAFISACGAGMGFLIGGVLAASLGWRWVFLVNVPIGAVIIALAARTLPLGVQQSTHPHLDLAGTVVVITAMMVCLYCISNVTKAGWNSLQTLASLGCAVALLALFIRLETRAPSPLMPLTLFRGGNLATAGVIGLLLPSAILGSTFVPAQYLQLVLKLTASETGITLMCANLTTALAVLLASPVLAMRYGSKRPLVFGLLLAALGLIYLARAPLPASIPFDVFPGLLILGFGSGIAFNLLLLCALDRAAITTSGALAGVFNTATLMGGTLGLAVLASIADVGAEHAMQLGAHPLEALRDGYRLAFSFGAICAVVAASTGGVFLHELSRTSRAPGADERAGPTASHPKRQPAPK